MWSKFPEFVKVVYIEFEYVSEMMKNQLDMSQDEFEESNQFKCFDVAVEDRIQQDPRRQ